MPELAAAVDAALEWPADNVAAVVVSADGTQLAAAGDQQRQFRLASVTKLLTAYTVLIAVEEGALGWDTPAGPSGSTVRHLIAHTSGLAFDTDKVQGAPGTKRIYSNSGFELLALTLGDATGMSFEEYLQEALCDPLGLADTAVPGSPAADGVSTAADLARFAAELQAPTLLDPSTMDAAVEVAFPGLDGLLPGFGRQRPNDWGLGFEIRDGKAPHWTGSASSPRTFGHFGQAGTFLWVDPDARVAAVALADRDFGDWSKQSWPAWTDGVLAALR
jgi:CubicO group peptidase (beta-lactamase class C family)